MSSTVPQTLPKTSRFLVCEEKGKDLIVKELPTPEPTHGSAVLRVLYAGIDPSFQSILTGKSPLTIPFPFTPGGRAVGRVAATGPDTTLLKPGQLALLEPFIRARDDYYTQILWGAFDGPTPASKKFMADNWSRASFAEYVRAPLENVWPLDEKRLCGSPQDGGLGYSIQDLTYLTVQAVPYGGFRAIDLQAGERVIIAPATGTFSGAAVGVAVAMGARVVAVGRNTEALKKLRDLYPGQVDIVGLTGVLEIDMKGMQAFGPVDAYIDISPHTANGSTHVRAAMLSLRQYGRACLMGVLSDDIAVPYAASVWRNLTIKGQYMYTKQDMRDLIKLAESGQLKLGKAGGQEIMGEFGLENIEKGFETVANNRSVGQMTLLKP